MECIHSQWVGLVSIANQFIAYQWMAIDCSALRATGPGKRQTSRGVCSLQFRQPVIPPGGERIPSCLACGSELEPPVRTPHTVYVKTLYRIGGQDYCRHHIIRAVVAAGVITEVKASAGPAVAIPRE